MAEWIISGNPEIYDVIKAFRDLKTIDWTQSANMVAGDIVYIYVSGDVKAIMFRCRVNAAGMEEVNIDDSKYYRRPGEFDGSAGRYMELEMLEEFSGDVYTRKKLMKHGFSSPMGPVRMPESVKMYIESVSTAGIDNKRFSVNNAIWIAAASYAFMKYKKNIDIKLTDCYITAPQIQKIAAEYTTQDVQAARIHQHCNGDHENPTHRYLRRIGKGEGGVNFRITAKGEFKDHKEIPKDLNWDEKIVVDGQGVVLKELYDFVAGPYLELVQSLMAAAISPEHAVWIAAACMTDAACKKKKAKFDKDDVLFDANEIVKNAVQLIGQEVTDTTIDSVTAMLNDDNIHFFVSVEGKYRISYMSEFRCVNEFPPMDVLNRLSKIEFGDRSFDIKQVFEFVNKEYTERAKVIFKKMEDRGLYSIGKKDSGASTSEFEKNMILYGPPGTGKTYNMAIYAVAICDGKSLEEVRALDYSVVMERYEQLKKVGRVVFTTFHQSYGYEEFIEGIKPIVDQAKNDIGYTIEPGVFKKFCDNARTIDHSATETIVNAQAKIWKITIMNGDMNAVKQECFDEGNARMGFDYDAPEARAFVNEVAPGDIILSFKTRRSIDGIGVVTGDIEELGTKDTYQLSRNVFWLAKKIDEDITGINAGKLLHRMTFAKVPNMQLKDVLALVKKCSPNSKEAEIKENTVPYVFVIDEINRGNISKIFGELITLIENTKRGGMVEATSAILPYSGDTFCVPANVYILGTMNTADRSIALMDTALRRRFQFVEMMPDSKVISDVVIEGLDVAKMLDIINERIAFLYDREHTIGHAFFTGLLKPENRTVRALGSIFEKSVIPLLQEYFYEDYQKIQLILGDNAKSNPNQKFVKDTKIVAKNIFVGCIEDIIDLPEKKFEINPKAFYDIESYKGIAPGLDVE